MNCLNTKLLKRHLNQVRGKVNEVLLKEIDDALSGTKFLDDLQAALNDPDALLLEILTRKAFVRKHGKKCTAIR